MKNSFSAFGKRVKIELIKQGKNQKWLISEVKKKTGLYFDSSYLSRILTGQCNPVKISEAIKAILQIE
nr:MAG TPA: hypothetical protein [Caudoviricetes sp.]